MAIQIDVNNSYQYGISSAQSAKKSKDLDTLKETRDRYKNADIFVEKEGTGRPVQEDRRGDESGQETWREA